jgi:hypothetical protein
MEETYMKSGGGQCPFCGSADIIGGTLETDTNLAWSSVSCGDCSGLGVTCTPSRGWTLGIWGRTCNG